LNPVDPNARDFNSEFESRWAWYLRANEDTLLDLFGMTEADKKSETKVLVNKKKINVGKSKSGKSRLGDIGTDIGGMAQGKKTIKGISKKSKKGKSNLSGLGKRSGSGESGTKRSKSVRRSERGEPKKG
jgi:hypothetical protein